MGSLDENDMVELIELLTPPIQRLVDYSFSDNSQDENQISNHELDTGQDENQSSENHELDNGHDDNQNSEKENLKCLHYGS